MEQGCFHVLYNVDDGFILIHKELWSGTNSYSCVMFPQPGAPEDY